MIVVFLGLTDAEHCLTLARDHGLVSVRRQLEAQIVNERLLPNQAIPMLMVRYGDVTHGVDIYEETLAEAMYEAMQDGADRHRSEVEQ